MHPGYPLQRSRLEGTLCASLLTRHPNCTCIFLQILLGPNATLQTCLLAQASLLDSNNTAALLAALRAAGVPASGVFAAPEDSAPVSSPTVVAAIAAPVPGGAAPNATVALLQQALALDSSVASALVSAGYLVQAASMSFSPIVVVTRSPPWPPPVVPSPPSPPPPSTRGPPPPPFRSPPSPPPLPLCPIVVSVTPSFQSLSVDRGRDAYLYGQAYPDPSGLPGGTDLNAYDSVCSLSGACRRAAAAVMRPSLWFWRGSSPLSISAPRKSTLSVVPHALEQVASRTRGGAQRARPETSR